MKRYFLTMMVMIGAVSQMQAQTWSLDKCVSYAMENNLTIKQTKLNVALSDANLEESKYSLLPSLNASASQSHSYGRAINPQTNSYVSTDVNSLNLGMNSSVTLFGGFQKINTYKQNQFDVEAEKNNLEKVKNDISLNVISFYLNVLYNQELLAVAQEQLEVSKLQVDRAQKNVAVGAITQGDVLQIKAQYATDELNVTNAENQLAIARLNLVQMLDLDPGQAFEVERPANVDQVVAASFKYTLSEVYESALEKLPDVRLMEYRYKAAQRGLKAAKGGMSPRLSLSGGLSSDYADVNPIAMSKQLENNFSQYFSFQLNIPIFNSHSAHINVKRAKINLSNAEINTQTARLNLSKSITQAIADLKAAEKRFVSATNSFESLREAFNYNQQKFDVGLINSVDYSLSKNSLTKAESDALQAKYDLIFRAKILDFYQGNPLTF